MRSTLVFVDGRCGFCKKTARVLRALDWLRLLGFVNYHDPGMRERLLPGVSLEELNHEMHVKLKNGRIESGFFAFRILAWRLPVLWIIIPILYLPEMPRLGNRVYGWVAERRHVMSAQEVEA